jgi:signal transduction histidine kinase
MPERTELASQVREIVDTFAPLARARRASVDVDVEEGVTAPVDGGALRQVLLNLLDNAVKYGPAGQTVMVGMALFGERVRLWVDDEGPGIPAGERARVFEPFRRLAGAAEASAAGCGIGLAVVLELVTLHGGRVWADAAPGGGARMVVELPGAAVLVPAQPMRVEGAGAVA